MTEPLKECPFCGGHAIFVGNGVDSKDYGVVHCYLQDCIGYHWPDGEYGGYTHATSKAQAIAAWNQRADAQGEPVAWMYEYADGHRYVGIAREPEHQREGRTETPLYTHPPAQDVAALVSALERIERMSNTATDFVALAKLIARTALAKHERNGHAD